VPAYRRALLAHRVAASIEHEEQPFAESYGTEIDVGSNRGQFAVFARRKWPEANLLCFEPLPRPRQILSEEAEKRTMHVLPRADDSSSLLAPTRLQLEAYPETAEVDQVTVDVRGLDQLNSIEGVQGRALLKIDVQGAELDVLRGTSGLLRTVREMLIECSL
jgi:FkbM family methyltransferase